MHSHLVIRHLLKQLDQLSKQRRDHRPAWLGDLAGQLADFFEPLSGVARVGYECDWTDNGWELRLFLGSTEVVGGREDGCCRGTNFAFDLRGLQQLFDQLDEVTWNVAASGEQSRSFLVVRGLVDDKPLCVKVYSNPPRDAEPGLQQDARGAIVVKPKRDDE